MRLLAALVLSGVAIAGVSSTVRTASSRSDPWAAAAKALADVEADIRSARPLFQAESQSAGAMRDMQGVSTTARGAKDAALAAFVRDWIVAADAYGLRWQDPGDLSEPTALDPRDAQILLMNGAIHEALAGPLLNLGGYVYRPDTRRTLALSKPTLATPRGDFDGSHAHEAENDFRAALATDPSLFEARLHLGRFLSLLGRDVEARPELDRAAADARSAGNTFVAYLATLFSGQLFEWDGDVRSAAAAYANASALMPRAPAARLALAALRLRSGAGDTSWTSLAPLSRDPGQTAPVVDPSSYYRAPRSQDLPALWRALDQAVRR